MGANQCLSNPGYSFGNQQAAALIADFTKMSAYGSRGHAWTTSDLSWDGIEIVDVTSEQIKGLAWDSPQQHEVEFLVDVETGKHIGGSSPERYVGAKC